MKVLSYILVIAFLFLLLGRTEIKVNPFSIHIEGWRNSVGWILIIAGTMFLNEDSRIKGYKEAIVDSVEYLKTQISSDDNRN